MSVLPVRGSRLVPISSTSVVNGFLSTNLELLMTDKIKILRSTAYARQAGTCFYCKMPMWTDNPQQFALKYGISLKQAERHQCTAEHLQARQNGGGDSQANIVAACKFCNQQRHQRKIAPTPEAYKQMVQRRVRQRKWHHPWIYQKDAYAV